MHAAQTGGHHAVLMKKRQNPPAFAIGIGQTRQPLSAKKLGDAAMHVGERIGLPCHEQACTQYLADLFTTGQGTELCQGQRVRRHIARGPA